MQRPTQRLDSWGSGPPRRLHVRVREAGPPPSPCTTAPKRGHVGLKDTKHLSVCEGPIQEEVPKHCREPHFLTNIGIEELRVLVLYTYTIITPPAPKQKDKLFQLLTVCYSSAVVMLLGARAACRVCVPIFPSHFSSPLDRSCVSLSLLNNAWQH